MTLLRKNQYPLQSSGLQLMSALPSTANPAFLRKSKAKLSALVFIRVFALLLSGTGQAFDANRFHKV
jgi:hypothetical protein